MNTVYLSPSVQKGNIGVGRYGSEQQRMNEVADVVQIVLEYNGVRVYRNRADMTLQQVVNDSNSVNPDIHVAIHSNAGGGTGAEVFAWILKSTKTDSQRLAEFIYKRLSALTPMRDRGIKEGQWLYEINKTTATACLVEVAFHDNPTDAEWILGNIQPIGESIALGILDYFNIKAKLPDLNKKRKILYKVQVGAFESYENARKLADELNVRGYDTYVYSELVSVD